MAGLTCGCFHGIVDTICWLAIWNILFHRLRKVIPTEPNSLICLRGVKTTHQTCILPFCDVLCLLGLSIPKCFMVLDYLQTFATKSPSFVGKYTSTMEHMGYDIAMAIPISLDVTQPSTAASCASCASCATASEQTSYFGTRFILIPKKC